MTRFPWTASGRAATLGSSQGLTKLVVDSSTERLLGAGIVGPGAGEMIAEAAVAIEMAANVTDLSLTIHPIQHYRRPSKRRRKFFTGLRPIFTGPIASNKMVPKGLVLAELQNIEQGMKNVESLSRCAPPFVNYYGRIPCFDVLQFLVRHSIYAMSKPTNRLAGCNDENEILCRCFVCRLVPLLVVLRGTDL